MFFHKKALLTCSVLYGCEDFCGFPQNVRHMSIGVSQIVSFVGCEDLSLSVEAKAYILAIGHFNPIRTQLVLLTKPGIRESCINLAINFIELSEKPNLNPKKSKLRLQVRNPHLDMEARDDDTWCTFVLYKVMIFCEGFKKCQVLKEKLYMLQGGPRKTSCK